MADEADTRGRIVAAARRLFCRHGFAAVGTAELCAAAGVNKGTLYHFFPGKFEVAMAAVRAYGDDVRAEYAALAAGPGGGPQKVRKLFGLARDAAVRTRAEGGSVAGCLHGTLAQELAAADPRARAVLAEVADGWAVALTGLTAQVLGVPPAGRRARAAAESLQAYLQGAELAAKIANDPEVITALGKSAVRLLTADRGA